MSDNQNLGSVPDTVAEIETVITDIIRSVDAAMSDDLTVVTTAGGTIVLTEAQVTRAWVMKFTGTPGAAYIVEVPATHALPDTLKKMFAVINTSGQQATVQVVGGGGASVVVGDGTERILYTDGADVFGLSALGVSPSTPINTQTASYTAVLSDGNGIVEMDVASANQFTIPTNASVPYPIGTILGCTMLGVGVTTVKGDTGVKINGVTAGGATIDAQFKGVSVYQRVVDEWVMQGSHGVVA